MLNEYGGYFISKHITQQIQSVISFKNLKEKMFYIYLPHLLLTLIENTWTLSVTNIKIAETGEKESGKNKHYALCIA